MISGRCPRHQDLARQWAASFGARHPTAGSGPSRSDRMLSAMTGRALGIRTPRDRADRSTGRPGTATCSTSAAAPEISLPAVPRGGLGTVLGVDVDARMADHSRASGLEVEVAAFEDWDPGGRIFDVVAAAQTWHWIDPVAGDSQRGAERLRPGRPAGRVLEHRPASARRCRGLRRGHYRRVMPRPEVPPQQGAGPRSTPLDGVHPGRRPGIREAGAFRRARAMAIRLGAVLTGPRSGSTRWSPTATTASSRRPSSRRSWPASRPRSTPREARSTMGYTAVVVNCVSAVARCWRR